MPSLAHAAIVLASSLFLVSVAGLKTPSHNVAKYWERRSDSLSCGVKGFDKTLSYNYLNDTASANFDKCSDRCVADSSCASFAIGYTQCLLYKQSVASNVNENAASPFTFYDRYCGKPTTSSIVPSSTSSVASSSLSSSEVVTSSKTESTSTSSVSYPTASSNNTSGYPQPTGSKNSTSSNSYSIPTRSSNSTSVYPQPTGSKSSTSPNPSHTQSEVTSPVTVSATSSKVPSESPETVISYVDVTITSCGPEVTACPTRPNGGSSVGGSSIGGSSIGGNSVGGSSVGGSSVGGSSVGGSTSLTTSIQAPESWTTVVTTHYVGICPTGYTTIPYTTTIVTSSGASNTPVAPTGVPAGFTTTVAVCPACNSASPTVTLTVPVVSVIPVPVTSQAPAAGSTPAGYAPSAPVSPQPPAGQSGKVPSGAAPLPPSAPPTTGVAPAATGPAPGFSNAPSVASPPYRAGNATASVKPSDGKSSGTTGLNGATATQPAKFTGGASKAVESTWVVFLITAVSAGLFLL